MSAIFISHSSQDDPSAKRIADGLQKHGHDSLFLDFHPEHGIPAGRSWERELYAHLDACVAVVVLCTHASMASRWCFHEIATARARQIPLFPLRLDDCVPIELLSDLQTVDLGADWQGGVERLVRGLLDHGIDPAAMFRVDRARGPYPGLSAFEAEDAAVFFGREGAIRDVRTELDRRSRPGAGRAVLIVGASGSGKSSVMRAGVLPRLERDHDHWLALAPFEPLSALGPIPRLADALVAAFEAAGAARDVEQLEAAITADPVGLVTLAEQLRRAHRRTRPRADAQVLIAIDQAEQLLDPDPTPDADAFLAMLRAALEHRASPLLLLATLRSDRLGAWQEHPALRGMAFGAVTVGPMAPEGFRQVIERPARTVGVTMEVGLADAIIGDVGTNPDALPLLAYALRELYEGHGRGDHLFLEKYHDQLGGVSGAIARRADELYEATMSSEELTERLRRLFVGLARLDEDGGYVRRPLRWAEIDPALSEIVERFVDAHLLVSDLDRDPASADGTVQPVRVVTVAHEALFRAWPRLRAWLADARLHHVAAQRVRQAQQRWAEAGAPANDLLLPHGLQLEEARELLTATDVPIADLRAYVEASISADDARRREKEEHRQRERDARAEARRQGLLVANANLEMAGGRATLGVLLALEAAERARATGEGGGMSDAALLRAIFALQERRILVGKDVLNRVVVSPDGARVLTLGRDHDATVWDAATGEPVHTLEGHRGALLAGGFAPDGCRVVTASADGTARVYDLATGTHQATLSGHADRIREVAFSRDGSRLVTASADGTARLWTTSGRSAATLEGHTAALWWAGFSPDGRIVATAADDGTARLWAPGSATGLSVLEGHTQPIYRAAFSPDGRWLATASWDATVRLWDVGRGVSHRTLTGHEGGVDAVAFSPDGTQLATGANDSTVRLWSCPEGEPIATCRGHAGQVYDVGFTPDGGRLASTSDDGTIRVWDATSGDALTVLAEHDGPVWCAAFGPGGATLVSAGEDGTARVWDLTVGEPATVLPVPGTDMYAAIFAPDGGQVATASSDGLARLWPTEGDPVPILLQGHDDEIWDLAYAPAGHALVTASKDGTAKLWDTVSGDCVRTLAGHDGWVGHAAFDPDGRRIATCGEDRTAVIWLADTGRPIARLTGHRALLREVVFAPDGGRVVTAADDGTARIWDAESGALLAEFEGHRGAVVAIALAPDGQTVATASLDGTCGLFDATTAVRRRILAGHRNQVWRIAFSPDGRRVVSASHDNRALIWDAETGELLTALTGHRGRAIGARFDPSGAWLLSASWDRTARLWLGETGACFGVLRGHAGHLRSAVFSPDGRQVLTAAADGSARLFDLPLGPNDDPIAHARASAPRALSDEERRLHA